MDGHHRESLSGLQVLLVTFPLEAAGPAATPGSSSSQALGQQALLQLARSHAYALPARSLPPGSVLAGLVAAANAEVGAGRPSSGAVRRLSVLCVL